MPLTMNNDTLKLSLRMGYEKRSNYVYLCFLVLIFIRNLVLVYFGLGQRYAWVTCSETEG